MAQHETTRERDIGDRIFGSPLAGPTAGALGLLFSLLGPTIEIVFCAIAFGFVSGATYALWKIGK